MVADVAAQFLLAEITLGIFAFVVFSLMVVIGCFWVESLQAERRAVDGSNRENHEGHEKVRTLAALNGVLSWMIGQQKLNPVRFRDGWIGSRVTFRAQVLEFFDGDDGHVLVKLKSLGTASAHPGKIESVCQFAPERRRDVHALQVGSPAILRGVLVTYQEKLPQFLFCECEYLPDAPHGKEPGGQSPSAEPRDFIEFMGQG